MRMSKVSSLTATILTGTLFAPVLSKRMEKLNSRFGTQFYVEAVENNYFGGDVSVAGLLTGGDLLAARERVKGNFVLIPKAILKSDEEIMLDGMSLPELRRQLELPVHPVDLRSFGALLAQP